MPDAAGVPLPAPVRGLRAAFVFLTRIPVGGDGYRDADFRWALGWFPAVGLILGTLLGALWLWLQPLTELTRAALVVALGVLLTGAMHEDGLADTADALGGAQDRDRLFAILKDSRLGTFGVVALCLSLLLRVALTAELGERAPVGLVLSHTLGRLPPVWLVLALPYVSAEGVAKSRHVVQARWPQALLATAIATVAVTVCLLQVAVQPGQILALALAVAGSGLFCAARFRARAGGITGDFLGATEQVGELTVLLVLCAV